MNLLELGGLLKKEREKHGLSLRDVMEATKISRRNLNALEGGEIGFLPHPVYLKGYVRNYARLVGLDAGPLVAVVEQQSDGDSGYLPQTAPVPVPEPAPAEPAALTVPSAPEVPETEASGPETDAAAPVPEAPTVEAPVTEAPVAEPPVETPPAPPAPEPAASFESQIRFPKTDSMSSRPPRRVWPWVLLLLFAAVMGALYVQYQRIQAEVDQAQLAAPAPLDNATNATNATDELNATLPAANAIAPEANASLPAPEPAPVPAPSLDKDTPPTKQQGAAAAVSASPVEVSRSKTQAAAPAAETRTPGTQQLVITAKPNEVCWVEVSEGAQRKSFTLRNGDSRRFEFSSKAKVRLGNAGGVSFQLNGAPYPFEGERGATATVEIGAH